MKPILAVDAVMEKLVFPMILLPKIDGVRALNIDGRLVARSGKAFKNKLNSDFFSEARFTGLDGEMVVKAITGPGICNATTSALTTIKGTIPTRWCLFDYVEDGINNLSDYIIRRSEMLERVHSIVKADPELKNRIWVIPSHIVNSVEEVNELELHYLEQGYEGIILRDPCGQYKYGRTTVNEGSYLRVKRFMDTEIRITHVIEGATNNNEKTKDPNGYAERSTHAENMVPNGRVGTICGIALETLEFGGKVIIREGDEIEVGAGKLSHSERAYYFENQSEIIGKIGKYQFFPIGIKDKPRFPTFQCFRDPLDMG